MRDNISFFLRRLLPSVVVGAALVDANHVIAQMRSDTVVIQAAQPVNRTTREWRTGDTVLSIRRNTPIVAVQAGERADWRTAIENFMRSPSAGGQLSWQWSSPEIPSTKPAVSGVTLAGDGRIWVKLHQTAVLNANIQILRAPVTDMNSGTLGPMVTAQRWLEPNVYDIYEADGRYVGQVDVPSNMVIRTIRGDVVWGVVTGSDDVQSPRRYRIRW